MTSRASHNFQPWSALNLLRFLNIVPESVSFGGGLKLLDLFLCALKLQRAAKHLKLGLNGIELDLVFFKFQHNNQFTLSKNVNNSEHIIPKIYYTRKLPACKSVFCALQRYRRQIWWKFGIKYWRDTLPIFVMRCYNYDEHIMNSAASRPIVGRRGAKDNLITEEKDK